MKSEERNCRRMGLFKKSKFRKDVARNILYFKSTLSASDIRGRYWRTRISRKKNSVNFARFMGVFHRDVLQISCDFHKINLNRKLEDPKYFGSSQVEPVVYDHILISLQNISRRYYETFSEAKIAFICLAIAHIIIRPKGFESMEV